MIFRSTIVAAAMLAAHPAAADDHRFEADPVATVHENFVACEVRSQLQRVLENPRVLLADECVPLRAGERVRMHLSPLHDRASQMDAPERRYERLIEKVGKVPLAVDH